MDSHHLARGRGGQLIPVLQNIQQRTLIVGISSDILCPLTEQEFLANHLLMQQHLSPSIVIMAMMVLWWRVPLFRNIWPVGWGSFFCSAQNYWVSDFIQI